MKSLEQLLFQIVQSDHLHAKWLNTLSYLENCGARKIAACEHPTQVKEEMLKHAAEEFRHAHYLKQQIERVTSLPLPDYSLSNLVGGFSSLHYLALLDLRASRYLHKTIGLNKRELKEISYLLVTYAIELRAEELYPIYHKVLQKAGSKVTVKSILLEEKEHLKEMEEGLRQIPNGFAYVGPVCALERELYHQWIQSLSEVCAF